MTCFTAKQRKLCQEGLESAYVVPIQFLQMIMELSAHPKLAKYPKAPITRRLRQPANMFSANDDPPTMVFKLINQIEAASLCLELVEVARQWYPFSGELNNLYLELKPVAVASESIRSPLEKTILIKPADFANPSEAFMRQALIEYRVCRIDMELSDGRLQPLGTGFLVGPDLVLTNYHVVKKGHLDKVEPTPGSIVVGFDRRLNDNDEVDIDLSNPGYRLNNPTIEEDWLVASSPMDIQDGQAYPVDKPERLNSLDYALLRLDDSPAEEPTINRGQGVGSPTVRGYFDLSSARADELKDGEVLIIFQHPQSREEENPFYAPLVYDMGSVAGSNRSRLTYSTSTMKGSSGSPCFDREYRLAALHHSLIFTEALNEGIPIQAIVNDLRPKLEAKGLENILVPQS